MADGGRPGGGTPAPSNPRVTPRGCDLPVPFEHLPAPCAGCVVPLARLGQDGRGQLSYLKGWAIGVLVLAASSAEKKGSRVGCGHVVLNFPAREPILSNLR